jgi:hypothetical protein
MLPYDVKLHRTSTTIIAFDLVSNYPASSIMPCDVTCISAFIIIGAVKVRQCAVALAQIVPHRAQVKHLFLHM